MSPIEALKSEAAVLQDKERTAGRPIKHCEALERVAKKHGYQSWRACCAALNTPASTATPQPLEACEAGTIEMKPFRSADWNFSLEIPNQWNSFPPVSSNSPYEVIRFASHDDGHHLLIVFRMPHDPEKTLKQVADQVQQTLGKAGFANFSTNSTSLNSRPALTLEFDKTESNAIWSCREYFVAEGSLVYALGFGTNKRSHMFELYDRMAKSFAILNDPPSLAPA